MSTQPEPFGELVVRFRTTGLALIIGTGVLFIIAWCLSASIEDRDGAARSEKGILRQGIEFAAGVLAGSATLCAAYYAAGAFSAQKAAVNEQRRLLEKELEDSRKQRALDVLEDFHLEDICKVRVLIRELAADPKARGDTEESKKYRREQIRLREDVSRLLVMLETAAVAVNEECVDHKVMYRCLRSILEDVNEGLRDYIKWERTQSAFGDRSTLYKEQEALHRRWTLNPPVKLEELDP